MLETTDTPISCPACAGRGQTYAHLFFGSGRGEWRWIACRTCEGAGAITPEVRERLDLGRRIRERRKAEPYRSLREEAARLGLKPKELGDAEWGRLPLGRLQEIEEMG